MSGPKRLVLADPLSDEGVKILEETGAIKVEDLSALPREELKRRLSGSAGLVVRSRTLADRELIEAAEGLEVIGRAGVGTDNIDLDAATRRGVAVLNAPAGNTLSTAELTFGLLLATARGIAEADRSMHELRWDRGRIPGSQLSGKTLGVVGAGRIGTEVILRARAFGMRVLVADPYLTPERIADLNVEAVELDDLLRRSDYVTLHLPLTEETANLIDEERIGRMQPGAVLINAARGGLVDEEALVAALEDGRLRAAALDVYEEEPLPPDHPLRQVRNLVLTPHLGASTPEAQREIAIEIAYAMRDALLEGKLRNAVNVPSAGGADLERLRPVIDLARRLGVVAAELSESRIERLSVRFAGQVPSGLRLVASAVAEGLLKRSLAGPLNLVNSLLLAEERGIEVVRSRVKPLIGHSAWIEVSVQGKEMNRTIAGSLREDGSATLVRVDGYPVNVSPVGFLLFVWNRDVPGVIGRVGTRLGDAGVNIGEFHQSRDAVSGKALAVIGTDDGLPPELLLQLRSLDDLLDVRQVDLRI
ncbi:MAG: phosphoglycerate dehydrogenase [Gemmatimonadota bacterium]